MEKLFNILKDLISPKKCYSCKKEGHFLCEDCFRQIGHFEEICPVCKAYSKNFAVHFYCKKDSIYYDKMIILTHYKNKFVKKLIKDAKFYHTKDILEDLSKYMGECLLKNIFEKKDEIVLIPTPMHFWKKLVRGYNQSEILVKNIAKIYNLNFELNLVKKSKQTKAQSHLSRQERLENLNNAFSLNIKNLKKYKNKTIVIVDDVVSTGTTINEISKILKRNGVKNIYGLAIASD